MTTLPRIVYEDEALFIVDKPAGMPSTSLREGEQGTLAAWLAERNPEQTKIGKDPREAGLVNRLDNETSGIVVAARTTDAHAELRRQFKEDGVRKRYLALVIGEPPDRGMIDAPIAHHPSKAKKMVACETESLAKELSARPAHTSFELLERYSMKDARYALLSVTIKTGARHQIRVHLAHIGFPISGDAIYRNPKKRAQDPLAPARHLLHSAKISIVNPLTNKPMTFESPLPPDFQAALSKLCPEKER